jgi:hypothetical protein
MPFLGYNAGKIILEEGQWYCFKVLNYIQLQDELWYYILQDINGLKHFMRADCYKDYDFKIGTEIKCKIDCINCTGRIYLEPEHPFYKEGKIYEFVLNPESCKTENESLIVLDIFGNSLKVGNYKNKNIGWVSKNKVCCMVRCLRKGLPVLELSPEYS